MLELSAKAENAIHMEQAEPDFVTPDFISEAAIKAVKNGFTHYTEIDRTLWTCVKPLQTNSGSRTG